MLTSLMRRLHVFRCLGRSKQKNYQAKTYSLIFVFKICHHFLQDYISKCSDSRGLSDCVSESHCCFSLFSSLLPHLGSQAAGLDSAGISCLPRIIISVLCWDLLSVFTKTKSKTTPKALATGWIFTEEGWGIGVWWKTQPEQQTCLVVFRSAPERQCFKSCQESDF